MELQTFILISGGVIIIGLFTWLIIILNRDDKYDEEFNFGFNFLPHKSDGRAYGREVSVEKGAEGRYIITLKPGDLGLKTLKKRLQVQDVNVIVDKNKIVSFPKGSLSRERNINFYLPNHAHEFPESFRETPFGKAIMLYTEFANAKNTEIDAIIEGFERQREHIKKMGFGEASTERMQLFEGLYLDMLKSLKEAKETKPAVSTFSRPSTESIS